MLICPQENPTRKKNKESDELDPPFFLSSSNTTWIDSTGSSLWFKVKGTGINGMNWWDEISQSQAPLPTTILPSYTLRCAIPQDVNWHFLHTGEGEGKRN